MDVKLLYRLFSHTQFIQAVIFAVLTTCMLTGCATPGLTSTPYQAATGTNGEGYSSVQLNATTYIILVKGNQATSGDTLSEYAHLRATEITKSSNFTWYRVISQDSFRPEIDENQQVLTAAPSNTVVDGSITGEVETSSLPQNQQCTMSGCEPVNADAPAPEQSQAAPTFNYYAMTVQLGKHSPVPDSAVAVN